MAESIPPGVEIENGLSADEAAAIALWNNASFRVLLAELNVSQARIYDAELVPDPQMAVFFPIGPKQFECTIFQAVDAFWLRPIRIRFSTLDAQRVADQIVQSGLNLIRDVRVAHADLLMAQDRRALAIEAEKLRLDLANLAQKRLEAGDISELEAASLRIEAVRAKAAAAAAFQDVELAAARLRTTIGLIRYDGALTAETDSPPNLPRSNRAELFDLAKAMRPDLRAAQIAVDSANAVLARKRFMALEAGWDANSHGTDGFESGPALRMTIPLFNRNRGNIAIADAQLDQATQRQEELRQRIFLEVETAYLQAQQAAENLRTVQNEMLPALDTTIRLATKSYEEGGASYFLVLETTGQFLDARSREIELRAAIRRALAELERSVGCRLADGIAGAVREPGTAPIETPQSPEQAP